jgi:hypothetical protein
MNLSPKEGEMVNKKSRIELNRKILSNVRKEMDRPRLAASVRNALEAAAELAAKVQAIHPVKA